MYSLFTAKHQAREFTGSTSSVWPNQGLNLQPHTQSGTSATELLRQCKKRHLLQQDRKQAAYLYAFIMSKGNPKQSTISYSL